MSKVWMPLYIGDYLADTAHLDAAEHGAYLLLMMHYWRNGPLPKCRKQLHQIGRLPRRGSGTQLETVLAFFEEREDAYYHKRIDEERQKAADHKETQRKRTEAARAKLQEKRKSVTETVTKSPSPSPSPLPSEDIGRAKRAPHNSGTKIPPGFPGEAEFAYPRSRGWSETQIQEQAFEFREYWLSPDAAKGGRKKDWKGTWERWVRNTRRTSSPKQSQSDKDDAAFREAMRRIEANQ